jgi:hypothetical protein
MKKIKVSSIVTSQCNSGNAQMKIRLQPFSEGTLGGGNLRRANIPVP